MNGPASKGVSLPGWQAYDRLCMFVVPSWIVGSVCKARTQSVLRAVCASGGRVLLLLPLRVID